MPIVDKKYYDSEFNGEPVSDADFPRLLTRAVEVVETMCVYRISESNLSSWPDDIQERFKRAVCAEIEYLDANGISDLDNGSSLQSAGLGKFSYTQYSNAAGSTEQSIYSPRAYRILYPTGLMFRGGCV